MEFKVKRCPMCKKAWEPVRDMERKYGTDWPMISKLEKKICVSCKKKNNQKMKNS